MSERNYESTKNSEVIKRFLDFVSSSEDRYKFEQEVIETENKRTQDLLHAIEFEPHAEARSKTATKLKASRKLRRESKDIAEELEPIIDFLAIPGNRKVINQLGQVLGQVRKAEKYHTNRKYFPRVEGWR